MRGRPSRNRILDKSNVHRRRSQGRAKSCKRLREAVPVGLGLSCSHSAILVHERLFSVGDPTLADGILDRLVHNAHRMTLTGESMRKGADKRPGLDAKRSV